MQLEDLASLEIPEAPGVYFFLDEQGKPLYIGKAAVLRDRIRSYFRPDVVEQRGARVAQAVQRAVRVEWRVCESVLEAMLLEAAFIRQYQPPANVRLKDDKSYWVVVVTRERWPRVLLVRAHRLTERFEAAQIRKVYGPFPNAGEIQEALRTIKRIFPFFDTKRPVGSTGSQFERAKIRFYQSLGLYPPSEEAARRRYLTTIRHICLLFEGKKEKLLASLEREMARAVRQEAFEYAAQLRDQIAALRHVHDVALLKRERKGGGRIEAFDISHHGRKGAIGVMVVWEQGGFAREAYRLFSLREAKAGDDTASLREVLQRRLRHAEWGIPQLIVVDGGRAQVRVAEATIAASGLVIPVVGVVKDERHKPVRIEGVVPSGVAEEVVLSANAEAHRFALFAHRRRMRGSQA